MVILREFEEKLKEYLLKNHINAEQYIFKDTCHSVEEAVATVNGSIKSEAKRS